MAAGDAFIKAPASVADAAYMDIQPGAGVEVVIHNIYVPTGTAYTVERYDGSNSVIFASMPSGGAMLNLQSHCTNTYRLRVKNTSGASAYMSADGMVTK